MTTEFRSTRWIAIGLLLNKLRAMEGNADVRQGAVGKQQVIALIVIGLALVVAGVVALVLSQSSSSSSSSPAEKAPTSGTAYPNGDLTNSRSFAGEIQDSTVSHLALAWSFPAPTERGATAYRSTPVISGGTAFVQDSESNVQAVDLKDGQVLWEKRYESRVPDENGVVATNGRIYGATATGAFALSERTGKQLWTARLTRNSHETISMPPGVDHGLVYVSTSPKGGEGGGAGILWALDAATGRKAWHFDTVPTGLWGDPKLNYGGGLLEAPAFDGSGGVYFGVGNPGPISGTAQKPWGSSRPGRNLYTSSIVKLDAKTGKLDWYYQLTPHSVCNWDLQGPPILVKAGKRDLVVIAGRAGIVIALDRNSGKLIWKRPVGVHNGHDNDGLIAMRGEYSRLKLPMTVYPGPNGGVSSPASTDGSTIFVPVVNESANLITQQVSANEERGANGEIVALDAATGVIEWRHQMNEPAAGATTVVNDLVFANSIDGTLYALDKASGGTAWQTTLPAGMVAGVAVGGDTVLVPAGLERSPGQESRMAAYRLWG